MAGSIGTITGNLTLETAAFIRDLGKASAAVNSNISKMTRSFSGIERAAKAAFGGFLGVQGVKLLENIAKQAIDTGDEIGEAASKLGIGAEALQRFRFAAAQTDVDTIALNNAMKQFQKNLATGQIKASTGDIAGAFGEWIDKIREAPTQLQKVELAVKAFAKQYQAALLIAAQGATFTESLQSAFVISQRGINIASDLDNKIRAVQNAAQAGFQTGFLEAFIGKLGEGETSLRNINTTFETLGGIVGRIAVTTAGMLDKIAAFIAKNPKLMERAFSLDMGMDLSGVPGGGVMGGKGMGGGIGTANNQVPNLGGRSGVGGVNLPPVDQKTIDDQFTSNADKLALQKKMMDAAADSFRSLAQESNALWDSTRTPMEEYASSIEKLNTLLAQHAISADTYARAHQQLTLGMTQNWLDAAGAVSGALSSIFKDNKAFAVADAVIHTAAAIVAALKNPPGPPFSFAYAAAAAAAGAAQIATILSTQPGSGAKSVSLKGGKNSGTSSAATSSAKTAAATPTTGESALKQAVTITIVGDVFGPEHFRKMVEGINGVQRDGTALIRIA